MNARGFTLLEVMVATVLMAVAVAGLLSGLSTSMRNAARLTERDRAAMLARRQMDELLVERRLPLGAELSGTWEPSVFGGIPSGWRARVTPFETPPNAGPGRRVLERIELHVWWQVGGSTRTFALESFRQNVITGP
jgi:general secretion pathway protein I